MHKVQVIGMSAPVSGTLHPSQLSVNVTHWWAIHVFVHTYVRMFCTRASGGVKRQVETQELHSVLWEQRYCISPDQT